MSYGGDLRENYRHGAGYVHHILIGTLAGELPVVQASRFGLVVNLKTARALGLSVPPAVIAGPTISSSEGPDYPGPPAPGSGLDDHPGAEETLDLR